MASGQATLAEIERAIADVREEERRLQGALEATNSERVKLLDERTASFRELAEVRTRHALADGVIDEADRLQHRVAAILAARETAVAELRKRLAETEGRHDELTKARDGHAGEIAALESRLDETAREARAALVGDPAYDARQKARDAARETRDKAKAKAERAAEDRVRKGKPYEDDPLFMYLWRRRYRLDGYAPHPLVRWADDRVARLVGYADARANYAALIAIPERLAEHVARLEAALAAEQAELEAMEARKILEIAGKDDTATLAAARERQRALTADLEAQSASLAEITTSLNRYAEGRDDAFRQAVEMSAGFLEDESLSRLIALARETAEPTDDEVVERIGKLDERLEALADTVEDKRGELERLARLRDELIRVAADFRRSHYDEPGSVFDGDMGGLLGELLKGVITGIEYSSRMRSRQRWDWRPADPFRRSSGLPPFGGRSGGGRTGGGGFRTGGSF